MKKFIALLKCPWFSKTWWAYLLEKPNDKTYCNWLTRIICRATGHGKVRWYNVSGSEPDMHCINCNDDLG